jgi:DNA replication protein DnaC
MAKLEESMKKRQEEFDSLPEEEKKRLHEEERTKQKIQEREDLLAIYRSKGITPIFYDEYWNTWKTDNNEEKIKALSTVKKMAWRTNLFLCGKSGTGKTHLAMCLTKDGAHYRRLPDIFREVRMNFSTEQSVIDSFGTVKYLIIDEVGRQKFTPFEKDLFFEIIDKRWNYELPTTLITNQKEKEFIAEYGTAILDRLRPLTIEFNWESHRESLNLVEPETEEDIDF